MTNIHTDKILILDFGAQYTQLIARRIREIGVYCEIWAWDHDPAEIAKFGAKGIILSGGPESTTEPGAPAAPQQVWDSGLPLLGICYGMQTMAAQLGGATEAADQREIDERKVSDCIARLMDGAGTRSDFPDFVEALREWSRRADEEGLQGTGEGGTLARGVALGYRGILKRAIFPRQKSVTSASVPASSPTAATGSGPRSIMVWSMQTRPAIGYDTPPISTRPRFDNSRE